MSMNHLIEHAAFDHGCNNSGPVVIMWWCAACVTKISKEEQLGLLKLCGTKTISLHCSAAYTAMQSFRRLRHAAFIVGNFLKELVESGKLW